MPPIANKTVRIIFFALFFVCGVVFIRDTAHVGNDFKVFWSAAHSVLQGEPLYSLDRDGGMIFKYPPWILPLFLPFGLFSVEKALWLWGGLNVIFLGFILILLLKETKREWTLFLSFFIFWGIWVVHALDGQIMILVLLLALFLGKSAIRGGKTGFPILVWALSTKIFTLFPLLSLRKEFFHTLLASCLLFIVLSVPAYLTSSETSPKHLLRSWVSAANSGGEHMGNEKIRERVNQGLPAMMARMGSIPARNSHYDLIFSILVMVILGFWWSNASQNLSPWASWVGWLALVPVIHPLSWFHLFVFAFPAAMLSFDRAIDSKNKWVISLSLGGMLLIGAFTEKTLGEFGLFLENFSVKSWGVLLCLQALVLAKQTIETDPFDPLIATAKKRL